MMICLSVRLPRVPPRGAEGTRRAGSPRPAAPGSAAKQTAYSGPGPPHRNTPEINSKTNGLFWPRTSSQKHT